MTKNDNCEVNRTVRVFSADGEEIGSTYPKRAKGLVRKGRALYVNDCDIRLTASDVTDFTEETRMDNNITSNTPAIQTTEPINRLYFSARDWSFNKECPNNTGNRSFMQGPDGIINEAYMIGNWSWDWTEIISKPLILPKNIMHTFTFWLNGGENDRNDEVCRFEIIFNNDVDNRYTYNLNRNFIRPLKKVNGWELYEIPFRTGDNEYTQLKFVGMRAFMTILEAKDAAEYADLPDNPDPFEKQRPQRHNIVFNDGWPNDRPYSTANLEAKFGWNQQTAAPEPQQQASSQTSQFIPNFNADEFRSCLQDSLQKSGLSPVEIQEILGNAMEELGEAMDEIGSLMGEIGNAMGEINLSFDNNQQG